MIERCAEEDVETVLRARMQLCFGQAVVDICFQQSSSCTNSDRVTEVKLMENGDKERMMITRVPGNNKEIMTCNCLIHILKFCI